MMSWHCSGDTVRFLKKLPALPMTAGSGSYGAAYLAHPVEITHAPWAAPRSALDTLLSADPGGSPVRAPQSLARGEAPHG